MNLQAQLDALESVAEAAGIQVSYEPMAGLVQGIGGLCRVNGRYRLIVDRRFKTPERVQIVLDALSRFDLEHVPMSDEVRQLVCPGPRRAPRKRPRGRGAEASA